MSKYERFIIYPLLFMALFYSLTSGQPFVSAVQVAGEMVWDRIVAREIVVVNETGSEVVKLHANFLDQGEVITYNSLGESMTSMGYSIMQHGYTGSTVISPAYNEEGISTAVITQGSPASNGTIATLSFISLKDSGSYVISPSAFSSSLSI